MHDAALQRRLDMIHVLEVTPDYKRLVELARDDKHHGLGEYAIVLRRACVHKRCPVLVEKLLTLPSLDQKSPEYHDAVLTAFTAYATSPRKTNSVITELLSSRLGDDKCRLTQSLSKLFGAAAEHGENYIKPQIAKMLVTAGADADLAYHMKSPVNPEQVNRMNALKAQLV